MFLFLFSFCSHSLSHLLRIPRTPPGPVYELQPRNKKLKNRGYHFATPIVAHVHFRGCWRESVYLHASILAICLDNSVTFILEVWQKFVFDRMTLVRLLFRYILRYEKSLYKKSKDDCKEDRCDSTTHSYSE